ncbi:MAG: DNA translocase FtsK 4TM domain-containing protein [Candidatus Magasanikbacteria bacterium]|nr:DNA translocase FtsK 4TM domain-containing protein [Candidatus Magasanikbacteria bacterium]
MSRRTNQKRGLAERLAMNPEIGRGLLTIILFIVSGLALLSFFKKAGVAGVFIDSLLAISFGQVRYIFPVVLFIVAALIIKDMDYDYRPTHFLGGILFFLSFNGLFQLQKTLPLRDATSVLVTAANGGGLFGLALAWPLATYVGYWGAMVVLVGLLLISSILLFNTSLATLVAAHRAAFLVLGFLGRQIIAFFALFKKQSAARLTIKGEYEPPRATRPDSEKETADDEEEKNRTFQKRTLGKEDEEDESEEETEDALPQKNEMRVTKPKVYSKKLPSLEILQTSRTKPTAGDIKSNAEVIRDTFQNFGIEVEMGEIRVGPTVTQYSLKPSKGIKLTRITALSNDLALALAAHPIRIEAPIPGQSLVGIEVPNEKAAVVTLRELLESPEFARREHNMEIAVGKDVAGKTYLGDLGKMPHLLVAGATGSGKTVCINTIILSLLFQNTPETLRLIMVDPKRVELTLYNGIPHLLTPVITDAAKTVNALKWTIGEMDRRFDTLAAAGKRDIDSYNKTAEEKMPYIVFVIDELADLMAAAAAEVEAGIIRLAQMARAVGIHLLVATQRPSVEVITGLMKANIPARIAFSVASIIDSRTILDCPGAEKLLGRGDMLFLTADMSKPKRLQGAYVSEEEMKEVVHFLKGDEPPEYDESIISRGGGASGTVNMFGGPSDDQDPLFEEAKRIVLESGKASASLLQRRLKLGYARAARVLDELEEAGIVGPADGAKPREIFTEHLLTAEEEIPAEEQTMDAGGTVLNNSEKTDINMEETPAADEETTEN